MATSEPGLDLHDWTTQMEALREQLEDSPHEALPELADLIERIMTERKFLSETGEPVTEESIDPEVVTRYRSAREVANLAEAGGADPGDLADAINNLRELFDHLVFEHGAS